MSGNLRHEQNLTRLLHLPCLVSAVTVNYVTALPVCFDYLSNFLRCFRFTVNVMTLWLW